MRGICNRDSVWADIRPEIAGRSAAGTERCAQRRGTNCEDAAGSLKTVGRVQVGVAGAPVAQRALHTTAEAIPLIASQIENLV